MSQKTGIIVAVLLFVSVVSSATSSNTNSSATTQRFVSQINRLLKAFSSEKKSDSVDQASDESNYGVEAREPSSGYGHGHGGGYGHGGGGGYGHGGGGGGYGGGWGWGGGHGKGGGGHGAITLDPVSIISLLALGAFLINNILQLLRTNAMTTTMAAAGGRDIDEPMIKLPLELNDMAQGREAPDYVESPNFSQFFYSLGSLYYLSPKKRNMCMKKVVCSYTGAQKRNVDQPQQSLKTKVFNMMVSTITTLVAPEIENGSEGGGECRKINKLCSDGILRDAKITAESKIYGTLASLVSEFALSSMLSG